MNIRKRLALYEKEHGKLPGIQYGFRGESFIEKLRVCHEQETYIRGLRASNKIDPDKAIRAEDFRPYETAAALAEAGRVEDAIWLCFLAAMVSKHPIDGWRRVKEIYQQFDGQAYWSWERVSNEPWVFREWLLTNLDRLQEGGRAGNHQKFASLDPRKQHNYALTVETYVQLIARWKSQRAWLEAIVKQAADDPAKAFERLDKDLTVVKNYGRLGRFDFLSRVAQLNLAPIEPGSPFLVDSTGPVRGANLLFHDNPERPGRPLQRQLNERARLLAEYLGVTMSVMEDALCRWKQEPDIVRPIPGW